HRWSIVAGVPVLAQLAQDERQRAEVILVAVRHDDRLDVPRSLAQVGEVGQHEVDADHLRGGKAQPHVDHDDAPVELDDRQVLADLPQASEGEDAQSAHAPRAWTGGGGAPAVEGDGASSPSSRPCRTSIERTAASSCSVASTSGRRSPPTSWPSRPSAAFVQVGLEVRNSASYTSRREAPNSARRTGSPTKRRTPCAACWMSTTMHAR